MRKYLAAGLVSLMLVPILAGCSENSAPIPETLSETTLPIPNVMAKTTPIATTQSSYCWGKLGCADYIGGKAMLLGKTPTVVAPDSRIKVSFDYNPSPSSLVVRQLQDNQSVEVPLKQGYFTALMKKAYIITDFQLIGQPVKVSIPLEIRLWFSPWRFGEAVAIFPEIRNLSQAYPHTL